MKKALLTLVASFLMPLTHSHAAASEKVEANRVKEISLVSSNPYANPFMEVELDAVVAFLRLREGLGQVGDLLARALAGLRGEQQRDAGADKAADHQGHENGT